MQQEFTVDGVTSAYVDNTEAWKIIDVSKQKFYYTAAHVIPVYRFDGKTKPWYKLSDVIAYKSGKIRRREEMFDLEHGELGLPRPQNERKIVAIKTEISYLPEEAREIFQLPDEEVVIQDRIMMVNNIPICMWTAYWLRSLIDDKLLISMNKGVVVDVEEYIKSKREIFPGWSTDRFGARRSNSEEQRILAIEPGSLILTLQRAKKTRDEEVMISYEDMSLRPEWFTPIIKYPTTTID